MGITKKDDKYIGKALISSERSLDIFDKIRDTLKSVGDKIYEGIADSTPIENTSYDPCKYCAVKPMCRKNNF